MASERPQQDDTQRTIFGNLQFGLCVWLKELKNLLASTVRCWEIRQLNKRLQQEYATLGKYTEAFLISEETHPTQAMQRSASQIAFLQDEISRLRQEHSSTN